MKSAHFMRTKNLISIVKFLSRWIWISK